MTCHIETSPLICRAKRLISVCTVRLWFTLMGKMSIFQMKSFPEAHTICNRDVLWLRIEPRLLVLIHVDTYMILNLCGLSHPSPSSYEMLWGLDEELAPFFSHHFLRRIQNSIKYLRWNVPGKWVTEYGTDFVIPQKKSMDASQKHCRVSRKKFGPRTVQPFWTNVNMHNQSTMPGS